MSIAPYAYAFENKYIRLCYFFHESLRLECNNFNKKVGKKGSNSP